MASSDAGSQSGDTPKEATIVEAVPRATKKARLASEETIKQIVMRAIDVANRNDWNDPWFVAHLAPNFVWDTFNCHKESSRAEHIEFMTKLTNEHPHFHCEVKDITVDVGDYPHAAGERTHRLVILYRPIPI